jgi:hypothetical protein
MFLSRILLIENKISKTNERTYLLYNDAGRRQAQLGQDKIDNVIIISGPIAVFFLIYKNILNINKIIVLIQFLHKDIATRRLQLEIVD